MNARGQVVDAWRQIKVQANSLQGVFNVQYDLTQCHPAEREPTRSRSPGPHHANQLTIQRANCRSSAGPSAIITGRP